MLSFVVVAFIAFLFVYQGVKIVPQQQVWIMERLGKFETKMEPGLRFIIPFIDRVSYKHSLKEVAIDISEQAAITKDNVTLRLDGILYIRVIDPVSASYGVADPFFAVTQLAQTTMRSEIGKMSMDNTFEERDTMNSNIVNAINEASQSWGIQCMRYEIRDINPPQTVLKAMELQVAAERQKRADILESEGKRQSMVNIAEAQKAEVVLASEGAMTDQINRAKGESEAIMLVAGATAKGIEMLASSIGAKGGDKAVALRIAEQYVTAFSQLAKTSNTLILPAAANDIAGTVAQALTVFGTITSGQKKEGKGMSNDDASSASDQAGNPWK